MSVAVHPVVRAREDSDPGATRTRLPGLLSKAAERELRRRLSRWARGYLDMPEQEIADAYQTAWRKVLDAEQAGRPVRNLEHALRWALANSWREECRRRHRHPTAQLEHLVVRVHGRESEPDALEQVERRDVARYLCSLAESVGELPWRVVYLRRVVGLSPTEVCERLGISWRSYRTEHTRAVKAICTSLAEDLADGECRSRRRALRAVALNMASSDDLERVARHTRHCSSCRRLLVAMKNAGARPAA